MSKRLITIILLGGAGLTLLGFLLSELFPEHLLLIVLFASLAFALLLVGVSVAGLYAASRPRKSVPKAKESAKPGTLPTVLKPTRTPSPTSKPMPQTTPLSPANPEPASTIPADPKPAQQAPPPLKPASPAPAPPKPMPSAPSKPVHTLYTSGDLIANRYEVVQGPQEKPSLEGGMGVVYICLDRQTDFPVALKTFKPEDLPDRAARDRFLREGTTWVNLGSHLHIVRCYEVVHDETGLEVYLALELIDKSQGREDASLRSWLFPGHSLPLQTALLFALQIARGMQHAVVHIPGFVHRDLKPENVLVGADYMPGTSINRLRVTDFGLASVLHEGSGEHETGNMGEAGNNGRRAISRTQLTHGAVGTPLYMVPEQWIGEAVGVYTDVYALGCILYEMLTGYTAADGDSLEALAQAHCTGNLYPLPDSIPTPVRDLLERCLALAPADRYQEWGNLEFVLASAYAAIAGCSAPLPADATTLSLEELLRIASSYSVIGIAYLDIGKAKVAKSYLERAIAILQSDNLYSAQALLGLGQAYQQLGDTHRAIRYYEQTLIITRDINDALAESIVLNNLGVAHKNLGNLSQAIQYYEQALTIDRKLGHKRGESEVLGNLGVAHKILGDANRAIRYYEQALTIQRELGDRIGEGTTLGNLGVAYKNLGDARQAIKYYEQALIIRREIGDRYGEGLDLSNLGVAYGLLGDTDRDISLTKQALAIWHEIGDRRGEAIALGNLGTAYIELGEARRAMEYLNQYLEIAREIGYRIGEEIALRNMGRVYETLGDTHRAGEFYSQALAIGREIGNVDNVAQSLFNISRLYAKQGDLTEALPLAQEATQIWTQIGSPSAQQAQQLAAEIQTQIAADVHLLESFAPLIQAIASAAKGDRQARMAVERSLPHIEQDGWHITTSIRRIWAGERNEAILTAEMDHGHTLIVCEILTQIAKETNPGITYVDSDDPKSAINYYSQQLEIARKVGDRFEEVNALGNLGIAYTALGDVQRSIAFYEKYHQVAQEIGERREEGNALGNLGNAYAKLGDMRRAAEYYEQALVILREAGDSDGVAHFSFNTAQLYVQQNEPTRAMLLAQETVRLWTQIDSPNLESAQQLVEILKGDKEMAAVLTTTKQAWIVFQRTESLQAMQRAVGQFAVMRDPRFTKLVKMVIEEQVSPQLKSAFRQRLIWLHQIIDR